MTILKYILATIGACTTVFFITLFIIALISVRKGMIKKRKEAKEAKHSTKLADQLMLFATYFEDAHTFNAFYILGKTLDEKGKIGDKEVIEIVKEVNYLNNLKCKQ